MKVQNDTLKVIYFFQSVYTCEHIFSQTKIVKSKTRTGLIDSHLENSLKSLKLN